MREYSGALQHLRWVPGAMEIIPRGSSQQHQKPSFNAGKRQPLRDCEDKFNMGQGEYRETAEKKTWKGEPWEGE